MVGFFFARATALARIPFRKQALDLLDQSITMASRGLVFENWAAAQEHIEHIGYYRLTGYLRPFKIGGNGPDAENFKPGTTFEVVHDRYIFDRKLRILILDATEKIEVAVRAAISNSIAMRHGPHWYLNTNLFAKPNYFHAKAPFDVAGWHARFIEDIKRQIGHSEERRRDVFIQHYYDKYSDPELPPCWMVFEVLSFGTISHCFKFLLPRESKDVCQKFGLSQQVLSSWLHSVSYVRNASAHHARLWNRTLTIKPIIPNARHLRPEFNNQNERLYAALLVIQVLLRNVWSNNHWADALRTLLDEHPQIPLKEMRFPDDWNSRPIWQF